MKYFALLIFLTASLTLSSQNEKATLKSVTTLVADKKYDSAYRELDKADPDNKDIDIVLMKQDILLNYFVTSMAHQMFALKDLESHEDIMDYRGEEGQFSMYLFPANEILDSLIAAHPDNCRLYKARGDYYYDVYMRYAGRWLKSDEELLASVQEDYTTAIEGKCADYMSHYSLGYLKLINEEYAGSMPHFLKSIELHKEYPSSHYNLAYAYLFTDDHKNALLYARNALERYSDIQYKADAARMIAQIYMELRDTKNAMDSYILADNIEPDNYYTLKPLLLLYIKDSHPKAAATLSRFYNLAPDNPTIYTDLEAMYADSGKETDLISFYKSKLKDFNDDEILGNLNFFLGSLYISSDKKLARTHFLVAKEHFAKIFRPDHEVFGIIEEGLKHSEG